MRGLSDEQCRALATALLAQVRTTLPERAPKWTEFSDSDPGITLLQLFAFLTENLLYGDDGVPPRAALVARRLADAARALSAGELPTAGCAPSRVNYFNGQLLTAADFQQEQSYLRARLRRLNHALHGVGIVSGLQVSVAPRKAGRRQRVVVQPGMALDPQGEELVVCAPQFVELPGRGTALFLQVRYAETLAAPVPRQTPSGAGDEPQFSRIQEHVAIAQAPDAHEDTLSIARLTFSRGGWRVDSRFKPPRARA